MYFFISLILAVLAFIEFYFYKRYLCRLFLVLCAGFLFFVLLGFNSFSPDLDYYKLHFEDLDQEYIRYTIEPFILFLMETSKNYGLTFEGYQIVFSLLTFSLFLYSIFKYSPFPLFVLLNFYFIPFFPDITQIRFFLGFAVFLFSLQFFYKKKWFFYFFMVIAILCHLSMIMMLLFLLLRNFEFFKNQFKSNIIIILGVSILVFIPKSIVNPILAFINPKLLIYAESEMAGTFAGTVILFLPFFLINNGILYFHNKYSDEYYPILKEKYARNIQVFIDLIQFSNFLVLFQYFIRDFSRINQNINVIAVIYLSLIAYIYIIKKNIPKAKFILLGGILCNLILYYIQFLMVNNFQYFEIINQTFTSNHLFDLIDNIFNFDNL